MGDMIYKSLRSCTAASGDTGENKSSVLFDFVLRRSVNICILPFDYSYNTHVIIC